jgi:hypothetical protein
MLACPDGNLNDEAMIDELRLLTELVVVATLSPDCLSEERIDEVLGVTRQD